MADRKYPLAVLRFSGESVRRVQRVCPQGVRGQTAIREPAGEGAYPVVSVGLSGGGEMRLSSTGSPENRRRGERPDARAVAL